MSETNNAINLLVKLGVDTASSKDNLDAQIKKLSTQLDGLKINIDINKDAINALENLSKIDLKGLSDTIKGAGKSVNGLGEDSVKAGNEIKKSFTDVQRSLDATFKHLGIDFQQSIGKGITEVDELKKAFKGMEASFNMDYEVIGKNEAGEQIRRVSAIEASFKNLQGQIEKVKFNNTSGIDMGDGSIKNLWLPGDTSKVLDGQMKQIETSISSAVRKTQEELNKLVRTGEITEKQFYELSEASSKMAHPNSLQLYNQRLNETLVSNKQLTQEKKEQIVLEERIRKLQNSIATAQARDPKGLGKNAELNEMMNTLNNINPASKGAADSVKGVSNGFDTMRAAATEAGRSSLSTMDSFKIAMEKFPVWMAASTVFYQSVRSIGSAISTVIELDTQMTVLRRVAGDGVDANKVLEESVRLARELGNRISDVNDGFIAFARQGFKGDNLTMLAEMATLLGNISDLSVDDASSTITAALKGFNMEISETLHVVNALNETDNNFAISTQQLAESLTKAAGASSTYGVSLEKNIGMTTAIGQVTRESGSVIGNSLKSIYSRINSVSGAVKELDAIGISVKDMSGEMRKVEDVLDELGGQWKNLTAEQQQNLGINIAGRYQLSRFLILMNQYDEALKATETATESSGSAVRENSEYLKSYEARINGVRNAWTEAVISARDSGLGDGMVVGLKAGLEFFKVMTLVIDKVGIFPAVLGASILAFTLFNDGMRKSAMSNGAFLGSLLRTPAALNTMNASMLTVVGTKRLWTATTNTLTASLGALRTAGTFLAGMILPVAGFMALGVAIAYVTGKVVENSQKQKELKNEIENTFEKGTLAVSQNREQLDKLIVSYETLSKKKESGQWDTENEQEYLTIQRELGELFPSLIDHIDEKGIAHIRSSDGIKEEIDAMEELLALKREEIILNAQDTYKDSIDDIEEYVSEVEELEKLLARRLESQAKDRSWDKDGKAQANIDKLVNETEIQLRIVQSMLANASKGMAGDVQSVFEAVLTTISGTVTPQIKEETDKIVSSLSFSGMKPKEIEEAQNQLLTFTEKLDEAHKKADSISYDKITNELKDYLATVGDKNQDIDFSIMSHDQLTTAIKDYEEAQRLAAQAEEDGVDSLEELDNSIKKITSSISYINGVLESYQENNKLSASAILELIEKYPELIAYIDDEAKMIEQLEQIRNNDIDTAKKQLAQKLSLDEDFYENNIKLIEQFVGEQFKFYKGDLSDWKNLAEAKLKVEEQLITTLAKQWGVYYDKLADSFVNPDHFSTTEFVGQKHSIASPFGEQSNEEFDRLFKANAELKKFRDTWQNFTLDKVSLDFDKIGTSLDKNTKSSKGSTKAQKDANKVMEESIFIADKYKRALELLSLEIKKQQDIQANFPTYSNEHQKALQTEMKLQQDKKTLLIEQSKALEAQIKAGKILQTGVVTSSSGGKSQSLSGWGGAITSDFGNRTAPKSGASTDHKGIDIAGKNGTRVDSNVSGTVTFAGNAGSGLGNYVAIKDASGNTNIYGHLQDVLVKAGQSIAEGMGIGTIGSSGTSTGNHLHFQKNDASGKAIDPTSDVNEARKGNSTASKEAAQVLSSIDSAKSELIALEGQIMEQDNVIASLETKAISNQISVFDNKRETYQRILDFEAVKMNTLDKTSQRYVDTLARNTMYLEKKQSVNQEELVFLEELRKSGKLSAISMDENRVSIDNLKTAMMSLNLEIQQTNADKIDAIMGRYAERIDDLDYAIQRSQVIQSLYEEGTSEYANEVKNQIDLLQKSQKEILNRRNELKELIQTENLSIEKVKEYKEELEDLSIAYWNVSSQTKKLKDATNAFIADSLSKMKDEYIGGLKKELDNIVKSIEDTIKSTENYYDSLIEKQKERLSAMDEEIEKEDRLKKLREIDDEITKTKNDKRFSYITADGEEILTYNKEKVSELEKQRDEMLVQYQREDLKKSIQDEITRLEKARNDKIEILRREIEDTKARYDELILTEEAKWNGLIESAKKGTLEFDTLMNEFYGSSLINLQSYVAESQSQIQAIKDAYASLASLEVSLPSTSGNGGYGSGSVASSGSSNPLGMSDSDFNKYVSNKQTRETGKDVGGGAKKENQTLRDKYGIDSDGYSYDDLKKYHDGGVVGQTKPSRLTDLANKLFNVKPHEAVTKQLIGELNVPPQNIPNFFTNLNSMLGSIMPRQSAMQPAGDVYHLNGIVIKADNPNQFFKDLDLHIRMNKS